MATPETLNLDLIADFVEESTESLRGLPTLLDSYFHDSSNVDAIHAVFRAVHSMKGCAAFMELSAIRHYAHSVENALDEIRNNRVSLVEELREALIAGFDQLESMLAAAAQGDVPDHVSEEQEVVLKRIADAAAANRIESSWENNLWNEITQMAEKIAKAHTPNAEAMATQLRSMAKNYAVNAPMPSLCVPEPKKPGPTADAAEEMSAAVDEFVTHTLAAGQAGSPAAAPQSPPASNPVVSDSAAESHANTAEPAPKSTPVAVPHETTAASADGKPRDDAHDEKKNNYLRVREDRVDEFLEQVSQLFVTTEMFKDLHMRWAQDNEHSPFHDELLALNRQLNNQSQLLQRGVTALRRTAISALFSKAPRMMRMLGHQLGKKIDVHLVGGETEIDKKLADDLEAPLNHLLRNVADHGIELPADREARGVPPAGKLLLKAEQTRSSVRIVVQDDGRGIDVERVKNKALEKKIISAEEATSLDAQAAMQLIFRPGFSTAEAISDVSGRGVGMDVVKTVVESYGGAVTVQSEVNKGTTFRIDIPIRQAVVVIEGLLVKHCEQHFIIPFEGILELVEIHPGDVKTVHGRRVVSLRQGVLDAVLLDEALDLPSDEINMSESFTAVVLKHNAAMICLFVKQILGRRQAPINGIRDSLIASDKMLGVAPIGGGRMALALNVAELIRLQQTTQ